MVSNIFIDIVMTIQDKSICIEFAHFFYTIKLNFPRIVIIISMTAKNCIADLCVYIFCDVNEPTLNEQQ